MSDYLFQEKKNETIILVCSVFTVEHYGKWQWMSELSPNGTRIFFEHPKLRLVFLGVLNWLARFWLMSPNSAAWELWYAEI